MRAIPRIPSSIASYALASLAAGFGAWQIARTGFVRPEHAYSAGLAVSILVVLALAVKSSRELSQLRRTEEELRRAGRALSTAFAASPVAAVVLDAGLQVTMWNPAAEALLGFSEEEARSLSVAALLGEEAAAACRSLLDESAGQSRCDQPLTLRRAGGEEVHLFLSVSALSEAGKAPWGLVLWLVDASERKRAQEALERERIAAERAQRRAALLDMAAHELRNPIASMKGILSYIRWRVSEGKPVRDLLKKIEVLEREVDRLARLLDEMLEAFRVHEGRLALSFSDVDLGELLDRAVQLFAAAHEGRSFIVDGVPARGLTVAGDFRRLEDVFRNLLSNAVKYSPPSSDIRVTVELVDGSVVVSVSDQGVGIPPEDLPHVFEGFYRGRNLGNQDPGGLGLGLFICKRVVEAHGGSIHIESSPGRGTTCRVRLPLKAAQEPAAGGPHPDSKELKLA